MGPRYLCELGKLGRHGAWGRDAPGYSDSSEVVPPRETSLHEETLRRMEVRPEVARFEFDIGAVPIANGAPTCSCADARQDP